MIDDSVSRLSGRCMYIWKLRPVLIAEMGMVNFVRKAKRAKFSGLWIKVGDGRAPSENLRGATADQFRDLRTRLGDEGIAVWGWHVPHCRTEEDARNEAGMVIEIAENLSLDGILMDAEAGSSFFRGDASTADLYARELRERLGSRSRGLAISSHDIPSNFPDFPFDAFANHATDNAPQVYYGGSPSVGNRLSRAIRANRLAIPFVPVGAGWIGPAGGCESASACAERAIIFMRLAREEGFPGYSFWHWEGAPAKLWEVLFTEPV